MDFLPKPLKIEALYFLGLVVIIVGYSTLMGARPINGVGVFAMVAYAVNRIYWRYQTRWVPRQKAPTSP